MRGRPSGARVQFSLHNPKVVGSSLSCALAATGCPLSVSITELSKAMVCAVYGTLHIKDPLPSVEKSRVVIPVAGFS